MRERDHCHSQFSIVVVAEGATEAGGSEFYTDSGDVLHPKRLGGVGPYLRDTLEHLTGKETRAVILGHLQRGGQPNSFDRMLATTFGACAVRAIANGERGVMMALQAANIVTVPLAEAVVAIKRVPPDGQLVRTARDVGISFGAPDEAQYHQQQGGC